MPHTLRACIDEHAGQRPDASALHFPDGSHHTYRSLQQTLADSARLFEHHQIGPRDLFACALNNSRALVELLLAGYYHERLVCPLNLVAGVAAQRYALEHCRPRVLFCNQEQHPLLKPLIPESTTLIELDESKSPLDTLSASRPDNAPLSPFTLHPSADSGHRPSPFSDSAAALLMYTSGTTGPPKGVLLTQKNLISGGRNTALAHQLTEHDIGLCVLPLYHINAQCVSLMAGLVSGSCIVIGRKFSVGNFFPDLERHAITWASLVPTSYGFLLHHLETGKIQPDPAALQHLRFLRSASAPLPADVHRRIEERLGVPLIETMGITEAAAQILANPLPPQQRKIGSVGLPFGNRARIADANDRPVPVDEEGELCVQGDNIMQGYYKDEPATAATFTEDGWLRTGDLARMDADGYFTITGRKKELIIKGGENIAPREIDEALAAHPAVIEAAAFARPCRDYGETVEACVRTDPDYTPKADSLDAELIDWCRKHLGDFKSPDCIYFLDDFPRGASGKIQRLRLAELTAAEPSANGEG